MTRPLLALPFLAIPAAAETCFFGSETHGTRASIAAHDLAFAEVTLDNRLSFRSRPTCDLVLFGVTVQVLYDPSEGDAPDWFYISVPPGFRADPPQIMVDDRDTGSVLVWMDEGAGM